MIAVVLYGVSAVYSIFLWRNGFRQDHRVIYLLLLAALGCHTLAMAKRGFSFSRCPVTNLYEATTFVTWTIVAVYLVLGLVRRLRFLGAFAAPLVFCVGVFALMPQLDEHGPTPQFTHGLSSLHASLILLGYGAFGLAAVAAVMYLTQERDLKRHRVRAVLSLLPPIQRLEVVTDRLLAVGLGLLTIGLALGTLWLKQEKGVYFVPDPKIFWSMFVWLVYLGLLVMRWRFHQGGRRFAWGAVASFTFVLLTFWGFNMLSDLHRP
ncbi:MAG: cytochrome c assembly protein [Verrucomicrobia bacterium]|nr:cytochrome c assembly protein [Verrucomicrobiota bacterium]